MANKVIAIEIGNAITRIVQMDYQTKKPKVYRHATINTPEGSYSDGYINTNSNALAVAIQQAIGNNNMNGSKNVIFTITSSKILTREVMIPPVKQNMIDSTVRLNLSEYFPIDLSQYEVSTLPLERITQEGDNFGKYRVLIVAADKEMIRAYEGLARTCGLTLIQVDYVGNSIYQAFKNEDAGKCSMILKVEEKQTSITIVDKQNLLLQRNVNYGVEDAIQEVVNQQGFGVSYYDEARKYIRTNKCVLDNLSDTAKSVVGEGGDEGSIRKAGGIQINEARAAVTRTVSPLIGAVSRVVDFYNSRFAVPIDNIYICGLGGTFLDLNVLFGNEMGIKCNVLKKFEEVQWAALGDNAEFPGYAATIGAAMGPIGLYNKSKEDKKSARINYRLLALLLAVLTVVVCAALYLPKLVTLKSLESEKERLVETERRYVEAEQIYFKYENTLAFYKAVEVGNKAMENPNDNILNFFAEMERTLPADSTITRFSSSSDIVSMTIRVADEATAAALINEIRNFDSLYTVSVSELAENWYEPTLEDKDGVFTYTYIDDQGNEVEMEITQMGEINENGEYVDNSYINKILNYVEFTIIGYYYQSDFNSLNQ
ncbi:MAG: pilus assembly protein PilM [Lachnospiraceae bacterium]|nr:pilus assembly protein PilM [Lachnospiraceae bacterium]